MCWREAGCAAGGAAVPLDKDLFALLGDLGSLSENVKPSSPSNIIGVFFLFLSLSLSSLQLDFFISPPKSFIPIFIVLICNVNFLFNLFIVFLQYFIFKVNILKGPQLLFLEMLLFCS